MGCTFHKEVCRDTLAQGLREMACGKAPRHREGFRSARVLPTPGTPPGTLPGTCFRPCRCPGAQVNHLRLHARVRCAREHKQCPRMDVFYTR